MQLTLALDVDGTIETSAGPVTVARLIELRAAGAGVVIVSPSAARPGGFDERLDGPGRSDNLLAAKRDFPADLYLYVSDNGDQGEAETAGFTYIEAADFR